ncbi:MAG: TonB-dependent receptor [Nitrospira sp.]
MHVGLRRSGHPILAAVLTVSLTGQTWAEPSASERLEPASTAMSEELELLKEEETVSIASRYDQPISQAPSNVYVITDEDIRQSGATDLPTVLRRIPGIEVMQMSGADFNVSARGDNQPFANKMLVLVDGRSIYVDVQAVVFWKAIPVTLPEIKRIEVLKGPASAVHGFNAFDGIINIITKSPEEMRGTTLQFGGGELGTISSAGIHAGTHGKLGYRLSVGHDQNQQWRDRDALAFRSDKFNVQTEYALSAESKLKISGGLVDVNRFDGQIGRTSALSNPFAQAYTDVVYERPRFFLRAWWTEWNAAADFPTSPSLTPFLQLTTRNGQSKSVPFASNTYNIESQHTLQLGNVNSLTYGVNYRHNTLSSPFITQFSREDRVGLYVQDEWQATHNLKVIMGARYDLETFINPTISPRVALLFQPLPNHTFRAAMSVAYRPPTLFETRADTRSVTTLPLPPPLNITTTAGLGSNNLDPEQIISYEVGYQGWFLKHRLHVRADIFFNHISDFIDTQTTAPNTAHFINQRGQADIYGGEAGVEFYATHWLSGFANYSYQEIGQSFADAATRGAPRFKWNAGLRGEWDNGLSGEVAYHYYGATTYPISDAFQSFAPFGVVPPNPRVGSYNLLNMRAGYRFWQQKAAAGYMRDAEVAVSVFNAFNDEHKEHPLGDLIGRRVMGWLTVRF